MRRRGRGGVIFWASPLGDTRQGTVRAQRESDPQAVRCDRRAADVGTRPNTTEIVHSAIQYDLTF